MKKTLIVTEGFVLIYLVACHGSCSHWDYGGTKMPICGGLMRCLLVLDRNGSTWSARLTTVLYVRSQNTFISKYYSSGYILIPISHFHSLIILSKFL